MVKLKSCWKINEDTGEIVFYFSFISYIPHEASRITMQNEVRMTIRVIFSLLAFVGYSNKLLNYSIVYLSASSLSLYIFIRSLIKFTLFTFHIYSNLS